MLYRVARRLTGNATEAEDLVGQALLNASAGWAAFDGAHPRSWLIRILTNCHYRVHRSRAKDPVFLLREGESSAAEPWNAIDWGLCGPALLREIDRLPEEYRLAVVLCDVEEMSYEEAALAMDVARGTAKSRLFRGRRILKGRLASMLEEEKG